MKTELTIKATINAETEEDRDEQMFALLLALRNKQFPVLRLDGGLQVVKNFTDNPPRGSSVAEIEWRTAPPQAETYLQRAAGFPIDAPSEPDTDAANVAPRVEVTPQNVFAVGSLLLRQRLNQGGA